MANAYVEAFSYDDSRHTSDVQEDILGMSCPDPSPPVWPDTDDELDLGVHTVSSNNELASTAFRAPWESFWPQLSDDANAGCATNSTLISWADAEDVVSIKIDMPTSNNSSLAFLEQFQTSWSHLNASAEGGNADSAIDKLSMSWADSDSDAWDMQSLSKAQPLLINLECALPSASAPQPQGASSVHAQPCLSSPWLLHLPKRDPAQSFTGIETPQSCASVGLQSTAATPSSFASPLNSAFSESETTTPHSQAKVASFNMRGTPRWQVPSFGMEDSPLCLSTPSPTVVPATVGPQDHTAKHRVNASVSSGHSAAHGSAAPATRSRLHEGKAVGALALKKARAMLPAVNLKRVASLAEPTAGLINSGTPEDLQAMKRPLPTLLQGHGMLKSNMPSRKEKPDELGIAR